MTALDLYVLSRVDGRTAVAAFVLSGPLVWWLIVVTHEFAHYAVARRVGVTISEIVVFEGGPLWETTIGGSTIVRFGWRPSGGHNRAEVGGHVTDWQVIAVVLAGPAVNIATALLSWPLLYVPSTPVAIGLTWSLVYAAIGVSLLHLIPMPGTDIRLAWWAWRER